MLHHYLPSKPERQFDFQVEKSDLDPIPVPVPPPAATQAPKVGHKHVDIPDVIKVLIAPGVEPEDVGIKTEVDDEKDDAPANLFS